MRPDGYPPSNPFSFTQGLAAQRTQSLLLNHPPTKLDLKDEGKDFKKRRSLVETAGDPAAPVMPRVGVGDNKMKTPIHELLTEDMVTVYIGVKRKKFHLHVDLLCDRSEWFRKALTGPFKEHDEKTLYLFEDHVGAFEMFVQWIYGGFLSTPFTLVDLECRLALYVMAEKFCIDHMKDKMMDQVMSYYSSQIRSIPPGTEQINYVYENTTGSCLMRLFMVRYAAYKFLTRKDEELPSSYLELLKEGGDFAADFTSALVRFSALGLLDPTTGKICAYHEQKSLLCPVLHLEG